MPSIGTDQVNTFAIDKAEELVIVDIAPLIGEIGQEHVERTVTGLNAVEEIPDVIPGLIHAFGQFDKHPASIRISSASASHGFEQRSLQLVDDLLRQTAVLIVIDCRGDDLLQSLLRLSAKALPHLLINRSIRI